MSTAAFTPAQTGRRAALRGATAIGTTHKQHRVGSALRAVKVFAGAAFSVAVLGEYGEEAGVRRRTH
ncbi:hypothetical protein [Streptomyces sp. NPDC050504]|uniref:hypothetical protein n=1 Tax=Streptomyces sp. NPDC050504 TaxID=3365618 RepID=UPI003789094B